jgi:uncharacterized membrane protein
MDHHKKAKRGWWFLLLCTLIGAIFFGLLVAFPYSFQKNMIDSLAGDGVVESFTSQVYTVLRIAALPFMIISISGLVYLIAFKNHSIAKIQDLYSWLNKFIRKSWQELVDLIQALVPNSQERIPFIILLIIIGFAIFFRYAYMWKPMGHDETYTFMAFASRGLRVVITDYHLPNNHVFHTILVNLFYHLFGDSPAVIRLTAFIGGILIIPATYLVGKIFYGWKIGLVAASVLAALPVMIDYSSTARGYTVITLFALIIIALAAYVKDHRNLIAWFLLVVISCLGLYTNPTMIYPVGMTFTWLFLSGLIKDVNPKYSKKYYIYLVLSIVWIVILTGILYLPIILSSGLGSIIGNDVVETLSWSEFTQSLLPRIKNTWNEWNRALPPFLSLIAIIGLAASFFLPKLPKNRRVPLILAAVLWIATALVVQRVAPWPRIWLFLLPFFVIWIAAGIIGLFDLLIKKLPKSEYLMLLLLGILIVTPLVAALVRTYPQYSEKLFSKGEVELVADFLSDYLQEGDVVVVTSPDTVVLKYYLARNNIDKEFTELVKGKDVNRSIVVVNNAHEQTLQFVLDRRSFLDDVQLDSAEEIYRSRRFILYQLSN